MTTFNIAVPDQGASKQVKTRVRASSFGDGYEQRVPDGLNSVFEVWTLNFTLRTKAVIDAIDTFLKDQGGAAWFSWTTPQGLTKKFKCDTWSPSYNHDGDASLSCVFTQVFDL